MENVIKQYIRNKKNQKIGMLIAGVFDKEICIGWSKCNKLDNFDREKAYNIAFGRALSNYKYFDSPDIGYLIRDEESFLPCSIFDSVVDFIERIKRYYKDKYVYSDFLFELIDEIESIQDGSIKDYDENFDEDDDCICEEEDDCTCDDCTCDDCEGCDFENFDQCNDCHINEDCEDVDCDYFNDFYRIKKVYKEK